jgi:hypothetical protein
VLSTLALVASLAAGATPGPLELHAPALSARRPALHQYDPYGGYDDEPQDDDENARHPHLLVSGWGGEALAAGGSGRSSSFYGGEVAWAFSQLDLGLAGAWYRSLRDARRPWTPVVLTRVTQRFMTRRGFEAAFSLGFGAGRPAGWIGWYQVALGVRIPLGPLFLGGEIAFEQYDIIRLGAGLGVGF